ncbi:MAG: class I SAM-dependent methyltransferase [Hyphomicrobiaceae bacterium]
MSEPMGILTEETLALNKATWNERAAIHLEDANGFYAIEAFRAGQSTLHAIEAGEIGDVSGKRLAHLQCHIGLDSLSLARLGADVTGLDFSSASVDGARRLAAETGIAATFVEGDVYEARRLLSGHFDIVYSTWGTINWLPDIQRWAEVVASLLRPGGFLYLAEAHPFALVFEEIAGRLEPTYAWQTPRNEPLVSDSPVTYTGVETPLVHRRAHEWMHPLSAIIAAVIHARLRLELLNEHELLPWKLFPMLEPAGGKLYRLPEGMVRFPLAFSLKAVRD